MDTLVHNFTAFMIVGMVAVLAISHLHRLAGSLLGVVLWLAAALVGTKVYESGGAIGLGTTRFSQSFFYVFCAVLVGFNAIFAFTSWRSRQRRPPARVLGDDDD